MADTLSGADTQLSESARSQATTNPGAPVRSTVLPRVEWEGPLPKVNASNRHRFEELGLLGEGGMGEVVLARDHDIERDVAMKRLPADCDLGRVVRFTEEIRTVGQLEHPNIVPVHDVGIDASGRYFFVMKHLRGETLESIINRLAAGDAAAHARFTFPVRMQVFLGVLHAMTYAHRQGYIHRDLKPANIMIGPYGEVTVMDWGLAKRIRTPEREVGPKSTLLSGPRDGTALQTHVGSVMGTPLYMSPEQARGENELIDERSDVYALTVLFHEFLHLEHYLVKFTKIPEILSAVITETPVLHRASMKKGQYQVPAELDWFLARGFEKDPSKRFQNVMEMEAELQRIIRGECRVQCQRTFIKRAFFMAGKLVDEHPNLVIIGTGAVASLILAAIVKSVLAFTT